MKKVLKISLLVVILGVFVWTIVFLYQKSRPEPEVFETQSPEVKNIIKKTVATGSVVPRKEIEIKPQVSGIVQKLYVEPGDNVKEGDIIAKIKIIPNMVSLNEAESRLEKAQIALKDAEIIFERQKKLFDKGVIAEAAYLKDKISFDQAKAEMQAAENNLQLIKEGATRNAGKSSNTLIRSTIQGMILDVPVEMGNSVIESNTFNEGTTIALVADMGEMVFEGKVDETEVGKIKPGMNLLLSIGAIENQTFNAILEYIAPKGEEENGAIQFEIKADVVLKDSVFIRAGYSANADIVLDRRDSVLSIEESLLQFVNDSAFVEIKTGEEKYEKRYIETGLSDGINIEIVSGIDSNDLIKDPNKKKKQG